MDISKRYDRSCGARKLNDTMFLIQRPARGMNCLGRLGIGTKAVVQIDNGMFLLGPWQYGSAQKSLANIRSL